MYSEIYRDVGFDIVPNGIAYFTTLLPIQALRWHHWSRFFTSEEKILIEDSTSSTDVRAAIMRKAIDRAYADAPVWTGDIRDTPKEMI
jgi:hypothetical protein